MDTKEYSKIGAETNCRKCGGNIGDKAYYIIRLDCMYDGRELSQSESIILCSKCNEKLKTWLNI